MGKVILEVNHMSISFTQYDRGLRQKTLPVIRDLSLLVREGELVAVVGASGSGKSLLAHGILGILPYNASVDGSVLYQGELLTPQSQSRLRGKEMVLVPQSVSYLDPLMKVGEQIRGGKKNPEVWEKCRHLLKRYGLGQETESLYPHELSGGMTRRILISTALMEEPRLVIADEPTPGLHLEAARRVLGHFREIANQGAGVLLITHDLEQALTVADRIVVFYAGTTIEETSAESFQSEERLLHPYTRALYQAMPEHGFHPLSGTQPYVTEVLEGCPFSPRCTMASEGCKKEIPYRKIGDSRVRCRKAVR